MPIFDMDCQSFFIELKGKAGRGFVKCQTFLKIKFKTSRILKNN